MPLSVTAYAAGSCAAATIQNLGSEKGPAEAMVRICKSQLVVAPSTWDPPGVKRGFNILTSWFIFVAGPEIPGMGHSKDWTRYGTEFAQFILDHKLGEIATAPARPNLKHHAATTCQTWLWAPDQKAVETWWVEVGKGLSDAVDRADQEKAEAVQREAREANRRWEAYNIAQSDTAQQPLKKAVDPLHQYPLDEDPKFLGQAGFPPPAPYYPPPEDEDYEEDECDEDDDEEPDDDYDDNDHDDDEEDDYGD